MAARAGQDAPKDSLLVAIDGLPDLPDQARTYLRDRWFDQLEWFGRKAGANQRRHKQYRAVAIAGGVLLPVLVNLSATRSEEAFDWVAIVVSIVVGLATGLEAFFRPGEKWLQYRQTAERLRAEWWLFVNLAGPDYGQYRTLAQAYTHFVQRTEAIIGEDVEGFVALMKPEATPDDPERGDPPA
jgi:hypothetical protein